MDAQAPSFSASRRRSLGRLAAISFIAPLASAEEIVRRQKADNDPTNAATTSASVYPDVRAQLVDTFEGPDWRRANVPLEIRWEREGGDWSDASGTQWGSVPFASATMTGYASGMLTFDAKSLVEELLADNTGIMLRSSAGMKLACSRSAGQPAPMLIVNGIACPLLADTWIDPSGGNLGRLDWIQLPALLKFDLSAVRAPIKSASLSVMLTNLYTSPPVTVDAFYLEMPFIVTDPTTQIGGAQQGIAATVMSDPSLAGHPSVIAYTEFKSHDDVWKQPVSGYNTADWFIGTRPDAYGMTGGDWGYDVSYVPVPQYGVTIGRSAIPGAADQPSVSGINMHRWVYPPDSFAKPWQVPLGQGPQELNLRYLLCLDPDVITGIRSDGGVKLPGLTGTYEYQNVFNAGQSAWSYRLEHGSPSPTHPGVFRPFVYAYDFTAPIGTGTGEPIYFDHNICLKAGQVYSVEQYVKLNTQNADGTWNADGVIRMYVDGVLALNVTNRVIRKDAQVGFYDLPFWCLYHGGTIAPDKTIHYSMGACVVAHEYIGPPRKVSTGIIPPTKPRPKGPKRAGRASWAAAAPLNEWIEIPGTRVDRVPLPPNPTAANYIYASGWDMLSPWCGPSFQQMGAVIYNGPQGGHADGWSNLKIRTVLNVETPHSQILDAGSPGDQWVAECIYYLDLKPAPLHTFFNHLFIDQREWDLVWYSGYVAKQQIGGLPYPPPNFPWWIQGGDAGDPDRRQWAYRHITGYDVANRVWLAPDTIPPMPHKTGAAYINASCVNPETGDVYFARPSSTDAHWYRWNCATNTHTQLPVAAYPYGDCMYAVDPAHGTIITMGTDAPVYKPRLWDMTTGAPRDIVWTNPAMESAVRGGAGKYTNILRFPREPGNFLVTIPGGDGYAEFYKLARIDDQTYRIDPYSTVNRPRNPVNGIFTKIHYSDELGGYVFHNLWNENVKFMRVI